MARPAKLTLALLLGLVLAAHLVGLEWFAREREEQATVLKTMAPPMFTRLLHPSEPPPVVAQVEAPPPPAPKPKLRPTIRIVKPRPKPRVTPKKEEQVAQAPQAAASAPELPMPTPVDGSGSDTAPPPEPAASAAVAAASAPEVTASSPVAAASAPDTAASAPIAAASAPDNAASAPGAGTAQASTADIGHWPKDTRVSYQLDGQFRGGPLFGNAHVMWQRAGSRYQVQLNIDVKYFVNFTMTSQGEITPDGLVPQAYEEYRPGKRRKTLFGNDMVTLDNGKQTPVLPGIQDTVSQFVDIGHRFAHGEAVLQVGKTVSFPLGRPGGVDIWTYDILDREMLRTPQLGEVEVYHLKPRPIASARGDITADMWLAPSLQYLPVKIRVSMGEQDHIDLMVDHIDTQ